MGVYDNSAWEFDESHWPVLIIRPKPVEMTLEQLDAALEHYDAVLERRRASYAVVFDHRDVKYLRAAHRTRIAEYNKRHEARARAYCRGSAFVIHSPIVRGMMTAILWIKKPPAETRVFEDFAEAKTWAGEQVREHQKLHSTG